MCEIEQKEWVCGFDPQGTHKLIKKVYLDCTELELDKSICKMQKCAF